jgi:hypothetical protein
MATQLSDKIKVCCYVLLVLSIVIAMTPKSTMLSSNLTHLLIKLHNNIFNIHTPIHVNTNNNSIPYVPEFTNTEQYEKHLRDIFNLREVTSISDLPAFTNAGRYERYLRQREAEIGLFK